MDASSKSKEDRRRRLLAAVHAAKRDLGIEDDQYREILDAEFGVDSAGALENGQLRRLLAIYSQWGWQSPNDRQAAALRARARKMAGSLEDGERRLKGLCKKICGVDRLGWCRDVGKLTALLAALRKIAEEYPEIPREGK